MIWKPVQVWLRDPAIVFSLENGERIHNEKTGEGGEKKEFLLGSFGLVIRY